MRIFFGHFCRERNLIVQQWTEHCVHNTQSPQTVKENWGILFASIFPGFHDCRLLQMWCEWRMANIEMTVQWNDDGTNGVQPAIVQLENLSFKIERKKMVKTVSHATHTVNVTRWRAITVCCAHIPFWWPLNNQSIKCVRHMNLPLSGPRGECETCEVYGTIFLLFHFLPHFSSASTRPLHIHMEATWFVVHGRS